MTRQTQSTPWYRQFWPWFLIAVPLSSLIMGSIMLNFAIDTEDTLVKDDYYKQGKAINLDLGKIRKAQEMQIQATLSVTDSVIELVLQSKEPLDGSAISLEFFHPTQADKDLTLLLTKTAGNSYLGELPQPLNGKWRVSMLPFDKSWKVQQVVGFPQQRPILLKP